MFPSTTEAKNRLIRMAARFDPTGKWPRFWGKAFERYSEPLSPSQDRDMQERLMNTVSAFSDIAPLMVAQRSESEGRFEQGIREIEEHTLSTAFLEMSYKEMGDSPEDLHCPLSLMREINYPFAHSDDRSVAFHMPCCISSYELLTLYGEVLTISLLYRRVRAIAEKDRTAARLKEFLSQAQRIIKALDDQCLPLGADYYKKRYFDDLDGYPIDAYIGAIKEDGLEKGAWIYPLLDSTEFYLEASQFYARSNWQGRHGKTPRDAYIIATSPGLLRPDEYLGDLFPALIDKIGPRFKLGGLFSLSRSLPEDDLDVLTRGFAERTAVFIDQLEQGQLDDGKNFARGFYFDNGIGVQYPHLRRHYITIDKSNGSVKGESGGKWAFQVVAEEDGRRVDIHGPACFATGSRQIFEHFVGAGLVDLFMVPQEKLGLPAGGRRPPSGNRPEWPRFLTLTSPSHWVISLRPPKSAKGKISHGLVISWPHFIASAERSGNGLRENWGDVLGRIRDILHSWGLETGAWKPRSGVRKSVNSLCAEVQKALKALTQEDRKVTRCQIADG